jgi:hypothetical protein
VDISITSASGESCAQTTSNAGVASCTVCGDGPFTVCVDTKCPQPCDVTNLDLAILHDVVKGRTLFTKDGIFIGDINGNGSLSTLDIILINNTILGLPVPTPINWCRFVPAIEYINAPNPNIQPPPSYASMDNCYNVTDPSVITEFYRFMVGDINHGCTDCIHGDGIGTVGIVINDDPTLKSIIQAPNTEKIDLFTSRLSCPIQLHL